VFSPTAKKISATLTSISQDMQQLPAAILSTPFHLQIQFHLELKKELAPTEKTGPEDGIKKFR
jgi:hypothetical protein